MGENEGNGTGGPPWGALLALVAIVLLAVGGWWLAHRLRGAAAIQDCVMSGRTNCAPVSE